MATGNLVFRGSIVLPDRVLAYGEVRVANDRIASVGPQTTSAVSDADEVITTDGYIAPGYIDLHVHGGAGADFMDGTVEAVGRVLAAHLKHGTTSLLATTTAARHDQITAMLDACRSGRSPERDRAPPGSGRSPDLADGHARLLGVHLYGPYFRAEARGCHPRDPIRTPEPDEYEQYLASGMIVTASIAPELVGAEEFIKSCLAHGVRAGAGHSYATFDQMADAVRWGVRHVDHLFCAMSDKARLRQEQAYPMRGGVLEATLFFDELTTEVIADGKHLSADLLMLARKIKGPDHLALVTDCNRALDMPDGEYLFGPSDGGERFVKHDDVGLMLDRRALASSVRGIDHMVRTFIALTDCPIWEAIRMASLTPARIAGFDADVGSLEPGKRADLLLLDRDLMVKAVYLDGVRQTHS